MNQNEIKNLEKSLPSREEYKTWTKEEKQLDREISCREMINSCLIYGSDFFNSRYKDNYIEELGINKVKKLYKEQLKNFNRSIVLKDVYQDSEGVTYNSLLEPEEDGFIHLQVGNRIIKEDHLNLNQTGEYIPFIYNGYKILLFLSKEDIAESCEFYDGRNVGVKIERTNGNYKINEVCFYELNNDNEFEI